MNPAQRARAVHHMEQALEALKTMPVTTPCAECIHFNAGLCHQWSALVPPEAQAVGCDRWEEDIPF